MLLGTICCYGSLRQTEGPGGGWMWAMERSTWIGVRSQAAVWWCCTTHRRPPAGLGPQDLSKQTTRGQGDRQRRGRARMRGGTMVCGCGCVCACVCVCPSMSWLPCRGVLLTSSLGNVECTRQYEKIQWDTRPRPTLSFSHTCTHTCISRKLPEC